MITIIETLKNKEYHIPVIPILEGLLVDTIESDGKLIYDRLDIEGALIKEYLNRMEAFLDGDTEIVSDSSVSKHDNGRAKGFYDSLALSKNASIGGVKKFSLLSTALPDWTGLLIYEYCYGGKPIPIQITNSSAKKIIFYDDDRYSKALFELPTNDLPIVLVYNLIPGKKYYYLLADDTVKLLGTQGSIEPKGRMRLLHSDHGWALRDCGGMHTDDGSMFKYNRVIRGGSPTHENHTMSKNDIELVLHLQCNVGFLIDLQGLGEEKAAIVGKEHSTLSGFTDFYKKDSDYYYCKDLGNTSLSFNDYELTDRNRTILYESINKAIPVWELGKSVYVHCSGGKDRTGTYCYILMALCDVSERDLLSMYEAQLANGIYDVKAKTDATEEYRKLTTGTAVPTVAAITAWSNGAWTNSNYATLRKCIAFGIYKYSKLKYSEDFVQKALKKWFSVGYDPNTAGKHIVKDGQPIPTAEKAIQYIKSLLVEGATYEDVEYTVTVSSNDVNKGTVTGGGKGIAGTSVTITATAKPGYKLVGWSDDLTNASTSRTITIGASDTEILAIFEVAEIDFEYEAPDLVDGSNVMKISSQFPEDGVTYSYYADMDEGTIIAEHEETKIELNPQNGLIEIFDNSSRRRFSISYNYYVTANYSDSLSITKEVWVPSYRFNTSNLTPASMTWSDGRYSNDSLSISSSNGSHSQAFDVSPGDYVIIEGTITPETNYAGYVHFYKDTANTVNTTYKWTSGSKHSNMFTTMYFEPYANSNNFVSYFFKVPDQAKSFTLVDYIKAATSTSNIHLQVYILKAVASYDFNNPVSNYTEVVNGKTVVKTTYANTISGWSNYGARDTEGPMRAKEWSVDNTTGDLTVWNHTSRNAAISATKNGEVVSTEIFLPAVPYEIPSNYTIELKIITVGDLIKGTNNGTSYYYTEPLLTGALDYIKIAAEYSVFKHHSDKFFSFGIEFVNSATAIPASNYPYGIVFSTTTPTVAEGYYALENDLTRTAPYISVVPNIVGYEDQLNKNDVVLTLTIYHKP